MAISSKKKCVVCLKEKNTTRDFYTSNSSIWGADEGRMPVCKDCVADLYENYLNVRKLGMKATIIAICRKLDIYYSDEIYLATIEDSKKRSGVPLINIYISKVNLTLSNKKLTYSYDDSTDIGEIKLQTMNAGTDDEHELSPAQINELTRFWGENNFENELDLIRLQTMFEEYVNNYSNDYVKRNYFRLLCIEYLRLEKVVNPKDRKDIMTSITSLTDKANISPKDTEQNKQEDDKFILGLIIDKLENEEPVDFEVGEKSLYKDFRGIQKYIAEYFVKPTKKAFGVE